MKTYPHRSAELFSRRNIHYKYVTRKGRDILKRKLNNWRHFYSEVSQINHGVIKELYFYKNFRHFNAFSSTVRRLLHYTSFILRHKPVLHHLLSWFMFISDVNSINANSSITIGSLIDMLWTHVTVNCNPERKHSATRFLATFNIYVHCTEIFFGPQAYSCTSITFTSIPYFLITKFCSHVVSVYFISYCRNCLKLSQHYLNQKIKEYQPDKNKETYIQGVPGGMCQTSEGCSLC
jgi:hypothetical protein